MLAEVSFFRALKKLMPKVNFQRKRFPEPSWHNVFDLFLQISQPDYRNGLTSETLVQDLSSQLLLSDEFLLPCLN